MMVNIEHLTFKYGRKTVLTDISLQLKAGKIYGLLGENGVGKTTLLKVIAGLRQQAEGTCTVFGEKPSDRTPSFLRRIYYLPEDLEFIQQGFTPRQLAKMNGPFYPRFDNEKYMAILKEFNVDPNQNINKMSQGQTKKSAIAFALATNVDLLLMDEPSNGLDIPSKTLFRQVMALYTLDTTCTVISTHQVRDLENLIDPIIILDNQSTLLNESIESIAEQLYFSLEKTVPQDALYFEPAMGGYLCVRRNEGRGESRINLEALFNTTVNNKDIIAELFKK